MKMRIWFPTISAGSGSDVYVERLVFALRDRGVDAVLQWFPHKFELAPGLLKFVQAPVGTDLVHANSWNGFAFARRDRPLIVTAFHNVYKAGYPLWKSYAQSIYHNQVIGRYERKSFRRAQAVVAMTPSAAAEFRARFSMPQTVLAHGWVDTEIFKPVDARKRRADQFRILIVGNESKRKGMDMLPQLRAALGSSYAITVVGGLRADTAVTLPGISYKRNLSITELVSEYQDADLIVSLSRHEGFGYTLLEAMSCGKPTVAFAVTGIRDVVDDGRSGLLVPPFDILALAKQCEVIANQPGLCQRLGLEGRRLAIGRFSGEAAVQTYLSLYQRVVA